ncbi:class III aminotransferase (plasmid) [Microvirga ossetica]|uniref:Class III aminotransferase n=1 Tax=Microvirga ossetica TaxID=1882682 RepID=A0A1B2EXJ4_9HYPH|nr:3-keto-5-aminohexanoate cleavage protein [Microvirga ossetica]ANY84710.1 class III aminotransferase [Microvirga ossetica]
MMDPLIITVAPNGARRGKADHPAIPLTPAEIGIEAARCQEAGAAMIHLHVRDAEGRHSLDPDLYRAAIAAVRNEAGSDLIVQVTTEAVGVFTPDQQIAAMQELKPEAFSVAVRELIPDEASETAAARFLTEQAERGVFVQHILYDENDVRRFSDLLDRGVIPRTRASGLFVLGRYTQGQQSSPNDLLPFLNAWALDLPWALCAFGQREAVCAITAACLGGHVRVGFENNLHLPDGILAPDNAALVRGVAETAKSLGLAVATPEEARYLFSR